MCIVIGSKPALSQEETVMKNSKINLDGMRKHEITDNAALFILALPAAGVPCVPKTGEYFRRLVYTIAKTWAYPGKTNVAWPMLVSARDRFMRMVMNVDDECHLGKRRKMAKTETLFAWIKVVIMHYFLVPMTCFVTGKEAVSKRLRNISDRVPNQKR